MFPCRTAANSLHTCSWPATGDSLPRAANMRQQLQLLNAASDLIASEPFNEPVPAREDPAIGYRKTAHMSGST